MHSYKANLKTELQLIFGVLVVIAIYISLSSKFSYSGWILLAVLLLSILGYNLFCSRLTEIVVDDGNLLLTLVFKNYFRSIKSTSYSLKELKFTYKRKATTFRGGIKNVCSLYINDKIIANIIPDFDGWDDSEVRAFVGKLSDLGIERKFVGYTLKDVQI